ncbi:EAL and HDOD domain-containing protein [Parachitinimonas caeni]|uniref:EAL domain-containing protein n=1 Tax=Parachitinimonas caeni TaxID=3031301 RepID=A0ABT7DTJ2_9NEIS|nr:EAL domain-containing protein [Parachitinimonas caeni]MDK2123341.1 EAL domain-containing protein [Parachitinimonas caeni]
MDPKQFFLGRQPIVGRKQELQAYELLFRDGKVNEANVLDDDEASASVIQHAFSNLGVQNVLGQSLGFINIGEGLLMSDALQLLPKQHVVLEILETVALTPEVIARAKVLKAAGYRLALDDVIGLDATQKAILPLIDVVKLDVLAIPPDQLAPLVKAMRQYPVKLLAEKIDTPEQQKLCLDLGFDYFQGYYFAKPTILTGKPASPSVGLLIRLLTQVMADADTLEIEETLKLAPDLSVALLRLINSVAFGSSRKIGSMRAALTMLGRQHLQRWVQIMVFASSSGIAPDRDPLVQTAATRGRMMELVAGKLAPDNKVLQDRAFMVGMLSLIDVLFGMPLPEIIKPLNLDASVESALISQAGLLGDLLRLTQATEQGDVATASALLGHWQRLDLNELNQFLIAAMQWAAALGESI